MILLMNSTNEKKLREILNTAAFGSPEWKAASEKLHAIRVKQSEKKVTLRKGWMTQDGEWAF